MTDDRFQELMRDAKKTYRTPPVPDLDAMWDGIESAHFGDGAGQTRRLEEHRRRRMPGMQWIGIAATLVVGIGLGRFSVRVDHAAPASPVAPAVAVAPATTHPDSSLARPYEVEKAQYLGQTAALLVSLPTDGHPDAQLSARAADLLTRTRLLMDSPAANDATMRGLLDDLELVLMRVVRLDGSDSRTDLDLINRALEQRDVIPRLRTAAADISAN
ncbi:MAG: hypothetical protein ACREPM_24660 [Gemmatimonadaceae bacterium]